MTIMDQVFNSEDDYHCQWFAGSKHWNIAPSEKSLRKVLPDGGEKTAKKGDWMSTAREVAEWMVKKLNQKRFLYQDQVVFDIASQFGGGIYVHQ